MTYLIQGQWLLQNMVNTLKAMMEFEEIITWKYLKKIIIK